MACRQLTIFTSKDKEPTLTEMGHGYGVETKATIRYSAEQLKAMGKVIDPYNYAEVLKTWKFVSNISTTTDIAGVDDARRARLTVLEQCTWRMIECGLMDLTITDFDTITAPPKSIERIALLHDTATLMGVYYKRSTDAKTTNKAVELALQKLSDQKCMDGLFSIERTANTMLLQGEEQGSIRVDFGAVDTNFPMPIQLHHTWFTDATFPTFDVLHQFRKKLEQVCTLPVKIKLDGKVSL